MPTSFELFTETTVVAFDGSDFDDVSDLEQLMDTLLEPFDIRVVRDVGREDRYYLIQEEGVERIGTEVVTREMVKERLEGLERTGETTTTVGVEAFAFLDEADEGYTPEGISRRLGVPDNTVEESLDVLTDVGLIEQNEFVGTYFVPD